MSVGMILTSITYNTRYKSQTQQIYGVQVQVNDNMFRSFYSSAAIIRSSKLTLRGVYKIKKCLLLQAEANVETRSRTVLETITIFWLVGERSNST